MTKLLHVKVLAALTMGCLLGIPPLKAQLIAQNRAKSTYRPATSSASRLTLRDALMQVKKQFKVDILFEEKLLKAFSWYRPRYNRDNP